MNWQDICNMCCGDRQAFWDKLARQVLVRYRFGLLKCAEDFELLDLSFSESSYEIRSCKDTDIAQTATVQKVMKA
jgi:hypothetical protein